MFKSSIDYHDLNAGAHRNIPKNLCAPTLTWHLAFWMDKKKLADTTNAEGKAEAVLLNDNPEQTVKRTLDTLLLTLCKVLNANTDAISDVHLYPCVHNQYNKPYFILFASVADEHLHQIPSPLTSTELSTRHKDIFNSSSRAVSIEFRWHEICVAIRCEIHAEYFSISTFAEVDKDRDNPPFSTFDELNKNIVDAIAYFESDEKVISGDLKAMIAAKKLSTDCR